jgi:hypothetical protein
VRRGPRWRAAGRVWTPVGAPGEAPRAPIGDRRLQYARMRSWDPSIQRFSVRGQSGPASEGGPNCTLHSNAVEVAGIEPASHRFRAHPPFDDLRGERAVMQRTSAAPRQDQDHPRARALQPCHS